MRNQLSSDSQMLAAVVAAQRSQFKSMADAWLSSGAKSFSVWADGNMLKCWPAGVGAETVAIRAPIRLNGVDIGDLRVAGIGTSAAEAVLRAEAGLVSRLARMEKELKGMTARLIDTQDQLLAMYDLTEATRHQLDMGELLQQLAYKTAQLEATEGSFLMLKQDDDSLFIEYYPQPILDEEIIRSCLQKVQKTGNELLLNLSETEYSKAGLRNLLFVPIRIRGEITAALGLINKRDGDFLSPDTKLARVIAEHAGSRMEHLVLYKESLDQTKLQVEADLAQQVQLNLLPKKSPQMAGLDLFAGSRPASHVGGDFYDFIKLPNKPFTFTVGDVSGKGMPAALLMAMTRTVIRTKTNVDPTPSPEVILDNCNSELYDDFTEVSMFATVFIGQYDPKQNKLTYANAGHSPVIYCPAQGVTRMLEADGTAMGVLPTSLSEDHTITLNKGDVLVIATDGFSEASNTDDEFFGYDRLLKVVKVLSKKPAKAIVEGLYETISNFSAGHIQDDDQTLIVLKTI